MCARKKVSPAIPMSAFVKSTGELTHVRSTADAFGGSTSANVRRDVRV